ncbi:TIGR02391 family protein [Parafilimonas sp.]|uniref:TIGR02391 family protein n=1 Tax=Parafilimonas sp. TaxID=1969739 RepID=UPI003F7FA7DF
MEQKELRDKYYQIIKNRDYEHKTSQMYSKHLCELAKYYSRDGIDNLSFAEIKKYLDHQIKVRKRNSNTVNLIFSAFKFYFNDFLNLNHPLNTIERPERKRREFDLLTTYEVQLLFEKCDSIKTKALMALSYGCGLEINEILDLQFADVRAKENSIIVRNKKKKIVKELYLPNSIIQILREYYSVHRPSKWLFEGKKPGNKYSTRGLHYAIKDIADKVKIPKEVTMVTLRYAYVKHLEALGYPLASILNSLEINHDWSIAYYSRMGVDFSKKVTASPFDRLFKKQPITKKTLDEFWDLLHPEVKALAFDKFKHEFYADAIETCLKALNKKIKDTVKLKTGKELDGSGLMTEAFSPKNPLIELADLTTESGKNKQTGYMQIFSGAMTGIRNPKAHENVEISKEETIHLLFFISQLYLTLDAYKKI